MAEAVALQVVVLHLAHPLESERLPREILAALQRLWAPGIRLSVAASASAQARQGCPSSAFSRSGASSFTSSFRFAMVNDDVTPTC